MGFIMKCSIVLLTITVVGAVLSSSSDSESENKEVKDADELHVEGRLGSGQDHARGERELNERIAERHIATYIVCVDLAERSSAYIKIKLTGCTSRWTDFEELARSTHGPGTRFCRNILAGDIGNDLKFIEVEGSGGWIPLKFTVEHGPDRSIKHECPWASQCSCMSSAQYNCPFLTLSGVTAITCRRV